MLDIGLILEGGAMRGVYTAGVLDFFLDQELYFKNIYSVSAGACQAFSYLSRQRGRNLKVIQTFIGDPRYLSMRNLIREGSLFGMQFMFEEIPNRLIPFDFETFNNTNHHLVVVTTDCTSGLPKYFSNSKDQDMMQITQASSSLPLISREVFINDAPHLDGGIADPIPYRKATADGNKKNIVVLTRNHGYRKSPTPRTTWLIKKRYARYPNLIQAQLKRHTVYNETMDELERLEQTGEVLIIRPQKPIVVKRTEKNLIKLTDLYQEGYDNAKAKYEKILAYIKE